MSNSVLVNQKKERIGISAMVYGIYCALLPFNMILNFTGFTINKYIGILASLLMIISVLRKHSFSIKKEYTIYVVFLCWAFITIVWSINPD